MTYPSFAGDVTIEIALGNGTFSKRGPTISFADTPPVDIVGDGGKWFYAGYFHVTSIDDAACQPDYVNPRDGSIRRCVGCGIIHIPYHAVAYIQLSDTIHTPVCSLIHEEHALCYSYIAKDTRLVQFQIYRYLGCSDSSCILVHSPVNIFFDTLNVETGL